MLIIFKRSFCKSTLSWVLFIIFTSCGASYTSQNEHKSSLSLTHPYKLDSVINTPIKFHPEVVSTQIDKFNTSFSPNGNTIYYTATSQKLGLTGIVFQHFKNGSFEQPEFVPFVSADVPITDVQISPDGNLMFFSTFKDYEGKPAGFNFNIWKSELQNGQWQTPTPLDTPINSTGNEFYPVMTNNRNIYFNSDKEGNSDIYFSKYEEGVYQTPIKLPANINSPEREADAFVARDESYIIFVRVDQEDGYGKSDLYISFKIDEHTWTDPINMGEQVNSDQIDGSPYVTPEGDYLIFTSGRIDKNIKKKSLISYSNFKTNSSSSNNGSLNFYIMNLNLAKYKQ